MRMEDVYERDPAQGVYVSTKPVVVSTVSVCVCVRVCVDIRNSFPALLDLLHVCMYE